MMKEKGFTLIEVSVASFLIITLGIGILGLQFILGDVQTRSINSFLSVESGNSAITQITRNLRKAAPGEDGSFPLITLEDNLLEYYSDIDFDDEAEKISYALVGQDLVQSITEPTGNPPIYDDLTAKTKTIASGVKNSLDSTPVFFYYNGDWPADTTNNPLTTPANLLDVKAIKIVLITNSSNNQNQELVLESLITLRSLKANL